MRLVNAIGYPLYNGYGMSEIGITSVELSRRADKRILGSVGRPFESIRYKLSEDGSLLVSGSSVCKRVLINGVEHETEEWFDTGDIMHTDRDGRYYIEGRRSDLVVGENGENLNPDTAEKAFVLSDAANLTVMGGNDGGLMLIVQMPRTLLEAQKARLSEQIASCMKELPASYRISKVYYTYDPLVAGEGIKVSRSYVRQMLSEGRIELFESMESASGAVGSFDDEIMRILRKIFADVLVKDESEILPEAHFMNDLGGSSLDYFTLIGEIDKRFDIRLTFDEDGFAYSLSDFAKRVEEALRAR